MKKSELVAAVAAKADCTKKDAEQALNAVIGALTDALVAGEKIAITGFGTFEVRDRGEKKCINPRTKEEMICPPSKAPTFKAGKTLKDAVNK